MFEIGLTIFGLSILVLTSRIFIKNKSVKADNGSIAIGGDNSGSVNVTNNISNNNSGGFMDIWNLLCGICSIVGLVIAFLNP